MSKIFISHSHHDITCAEQLRLDLENAGYTPWKDSESISPGEPSFARAIEAGIRSCVATIVIWSKNAANSEWVERELLYSQRLKKTIYPIMLDDTPLSILIIGVQGVKSNSSCSKAILDLLKYLPPSDSTDELQSVFDLISHPHVKMRKEGIRIATELIRSGKFKNELFAILTEVVNHDLINSVKTEAKKTLDLFNTQNDLSELEQSPHKFGVRCSQGHISYFDRRIICPNSGVVKRSTQNRAGKRLDDIYLKCINCGEEMVVPVDCENYK